MIGQTIGSYTILDRLGAGAMGEVFLGEHRLLKRKVAIKMLAKELMSRPELLERFFNEARATSVVAHPGIVQIFDCEVDREGRPYIVMEYLTGETLGKELARRRGPLPLTRATRLAQGIAEALEAAHAKGIIHRDLKPDNVFVTAEPVNAVKVVDFGIAKLVGDMRAGTANQTHAGAIMGTPLYMSPEQCRASGAVDFRTDIYSLGCVLFEMLTGRPPFTSEGVGELIVDHLQVTPPDVTTLNPSVPAPLAGLVAEMLLKNPAERPASMSVVAMRLSGALDTAPPVSSTASGAATVAAPRASVTTFGSTAAELRPPSSVNEEPDDVFPARRSRAPLIAAVLVVLLAGGGALFWLSRGKDAAPVAESPSAPAPVRLPAASASTSPATSPEAPRARPSSTSAGAGMTARPSEPVAASERARTSAKPSEPRPGPGRREAKREEPTEAKTPPPERAVVVAPPLVEPPPPPPPPEEKPAKSEEPPVIDRSAEERPNKSAVPAVVGTWEGPWADATAGQDGRLLLVVGPGGEASGWFDNKKANQSFRLLGRVKELGQVDLVCQCTKEQMFTVKGSLKANGDTLSGPLSLWADGKAFGRPFVNATRKP